MIIQRETTPITATTLADVLAGKGYGWDSEKMLQSALYGVLELNGIDARREVTIGHCTRIDFLAARTGIEVKIGGSLTKVAEQLQRYAQSDQVDDLLLVTTQHEHKALEGTIGGKPVTVYVVDGRYL